jgi:predicted metal-dependent peptidase
MLTKAKLRLRSWVPYLTHVFSMMRTIETDKVPTMAVDQHNRLYCNEEFMSTLTPMQVAYCLLHEVMHVVLSHCKRFKAVAPEWTERERYCWNLAVDLVVQQMLEKHTGAHEPPGIVRLDGCIPDSQVRYLSIPGLRAGMTGEQYYGLLLPYIPQEGGKPDPNNPLDPKNAGSNSDGQPRDYEEKTTGVEQGMVEHALREAEKKIDEIESRSPGSVSAALRKSLERRLRPQPDPFAELRTVVGRATASPVGSEDYTYRKLSRRQQPDQARRRGVVRLAPECSIIIDTSGSMQGTEMRCFKAIADGLRRVHRPRVIAFDSRLQSAQRISSLEQFQFQGYGGTDMTAAIEEEDRTKRPDCIVLVTDGETQWPARRTRARLIVALVRGKPGYSTPPSWAKVIDLTKEVPGYDG